MSDERPLISVIITSYNYLHFITQAIDSVRAQTYPNVEIVVVDNASTDGTVPAIRARYRDDPRVRIFQNEANLGEHRNANRGFEHSTGDFVTWLSADDWLLPRHLERLYAVFERTPAVDVVHSGAYLAEEHGRVWTLRQMPGQLPFDYVDARDELVDMFLTNCPLCYPAALFRRSVFLDVGLEDRRRRHSRHRLGAPDPDGGRGQAVRVSLRIPRSSSACTARSRPARPAYVEPGRNVRDFLLILDLYIDVPAMDRLRGREAGIVRNLDSLVQQARAAAGSDPFSPAERARIEARARRPRGSRRGLRAGPRSGTAHQRDHADAAITAARGPRDRLGGTADPRQLGDRRLRSRTDAAGRMAPFAPRLGAHPLRAHAAVAGTRPRPQPRAASGARRIPRVPRRGAHVRAEPPRHAGRGDRGGGNVDRRHLGPVLPRSARRPSARLHAGGRVPHPPYARRSRRAQRDRSGPAVERGDVLPAHARSRGRVRPEPVADPRGLRVPLAPRGAAADRVLVRTHARAARSARPRQRAGRAPAPVPAEPRPHLRGESGRRAARGPAAASTAPPSSARSNGLAGKGSGVREVARQLFSVLAGRAVVHAS